MIVRFNTLWIEHLCTCTETVYADPAISISTGGMGLWPEVEGIACGALTCETTCGLIAAVAPMEIIRSAMNWNYDVDGHEVVGTCEYDSDVVHMICDCNGSTPRRHHAHTWHDLNGATLSLYIERWNDDTYDMLSHPQCKCVEDTGYSSYEDVVLMDALYFCCSISYWTTEIETHNNHQNDMKSNIRTQRE